jgi:drug/metabolite transporter (DMT)-like permease
MTAMPAPKPRLLPALPEGVPAILAAIFAMALTDAIIKMSSAEMLLWQLWTLRSAIMLPVLFLMARGAVGGAALPWVGLRTLALIGMYAAMYPTFPFIDLSLAGAAFYTAPLLIVLLSALVLRQRIPPVQIAAIVTGFIGLQLIVRPFAASFIPVILGPVTAAMFYAVAAILTRARCVQVPPAMQAFWLNAAFLACGVLGLAVISSGLIHTEMAFPFLLAPWKPMELVDWALMAGQALLVLVIALGVARAYQSPQASVIATFDYCYVIFATFWGFLFFGEVPDAWTLAGMLLITGGGGILSGRRRPDPDLG